MARIAVGVAARVDRVIDKSLRVINSALGPSSHFLAAGDSVIDTVLRFITEVGASIFAGLGREDKTKDRAETQADGKC